MGVRALARAEIHRACAPCRRHVILAVDTTPYYGLKGLRTLLVQGASPPPPPPPASILALHHSKLPNIHSPPHRQPSAASYSYSTTAPLLRRTAPSARRLTLLVALLARPSFVNPEPHHVPLSPNDPVPTLGSHDSTSPSASTHIENRLWPARYHPAPVKAYMVAKARSDSASPQPRPPASQGTIQLNPRGPRRIAPDSNQ